MNDSIVTYMALPHYQESKPCGVVDDCQLRNNIKFVETQLSDSSCSIVNCLSMTILRLGYHILEDDYQ